MRGENVRRRSEPDGPLNYQKTDRPAETQLQTFREGQSVELVISAQTDLGYKAVINDSETGMLYKNEVFQPLTKGQRLTGFVKKIREDGKIDLTLQKPGYEKIGSISDAVMNVIKAHGGFIPVTDKSPADVVYGLFGVSKKSFKKAVGALYKKRLVLLEENGIRLRVKAESAKETQTAPSAKLHKDY